jgi:hypothetical protein
MHDFEFLNGLTSGCIALYYVNNPQCINTIIDDATCNLYIRAANELALRYSEYPEYMQIFRRLSFQIFKYKPVQEIFS